MREFQTELLTALLRREIDDQNRKVLEKQREQAEKSARA